MSATDDLRQEHARRVLSERASRESIEREMALKVRHQDAVRAEIIAQTAAAAPVDYGRWMDEFLRLGGEPTHWYDYPQPMTFRVASSDLELGPLYGASSLSIIALRGVRITGVPGHSTVYMMDDPLRPCWWVPVYSDCVVEM